MKSDEVSFLVDCGLVQGSQYAMAENREDLLYVSKTINHLIVTHAHMDHIGRIPKLVKDGFGGVIHSTAQTKEIASIMLDDAFRLLSREAEAHNLSPIYDKENIAQALSLWQTHEYHTPFSLSPNVSVELKDAGHILGSSIVEVSAGNSKMIFTGDLGNSPTPLLPDTEKVSGAKYMVVESVYGDRNHEPKKERDEKLKKVLFDALNRGGTVVIPTFSIERTQVILYEINELVEHANLPRVPVFLDSPLGLKVTEVYKRYTNLFNEKIREHIKNGDDIFDFPGLRFVRNPEESRAIDFMKGPKIIMAGSGMSVGGRVLQHERVYLSDPNATILLVGYQVAGSLGRHIEEGQKKVTVNGESVEVKAKIEKISGYSSHKDSNGIVDFVSDTADTLKKVFVAMGEPKSSLFLVQRLRDELGVDATFPEKGKEYELEF
jgi:metallo-beta-lactamase family protein